MRKLAVATMLVIVLATPALADDGKPKPAAVVVHAGGGVVTVGTIYWAGTDSTTSVGPYMTLGADVLLGRHASIGAYFVYSDLDEVILRSAGVSLKVRFPIGEMFEVRIGVGAAYQSADLYVSNTDTVPIYGLGVAPFAELGITPHRNFGLALQVSGISQPVGGNAAFEATWYPVPTMALLGEVRL